MKNKIVKTSIFFVKSFMLLALILCIAIDVLLTIGISQYLLIFYILNALICLFSFIGTFFAKYRKTSYFIFLGSLLIYLTLNCIPQVSDKLNADKCLDNGHGVWDYKEHRCRTDCWRWTFEKGCEKE